jgi:hypothetical protein
MKKDDASKDKTTMVEVPTINWRRRRSNFTEMFNVDHYISFRFSFAKYLANVCGSREQVCLSEETAPEKISAKFECWRRFC